MREAKQARAAQELRPLVLIPTYNERENLAAIVAATLAALPVARVLVIDDASPDGTGALADELARAEMPANTAVHTIAAHYLLDYGTEAQKRRWLPGLASGELLVFIDGAPVM